MEASFLTFWESRPSSLKTPAKIFEAFIFSASCSVHLRKHFKPETAHFVQTRLISAFYSTQLHHILQHIWSNHTCIPLHQTVHRIHWHMVTFFSYKHCLFCLLKPAYVLLSIESQFVHSYNTHVYKNKINRATVLVAVALSIFVGSGDLCWYAWSKRPASPSPLHVALARGVCANRALRVTHGPSWSSFTCCRRAVVSTLWGLPSGTPPPSLPLLFSLGHLGVQQQL